MIEPNIYCKVSGMTMRCISLYNDEHEHDVLPIVVEIGCADGQGTMRYAGFTRKTICVDPMVNGRPDIFSKEKSNVKEDSEKVELFRRRTQDFNVSLVKGCSMWKETIEEVSKLLDGEKCDILVIDGCHHPFEAVWGDFSLYYPIVKKGGFIVFDDLYEDCILQAYEKAKSDMMMEEVSEWKIGNEKILQHCAALRKTEE